MQTSKMKNSAEVRPVALLIIKCFTLGLGQHVDELTH